MAQIQFSDQLRYFRAKRTVASGHWLDVKNSEHDLVFTVPGIRDAHLLGEIREHVDASIAEGRTLNEFSRAMRGLSARYQWDGGDDEDVVRRIFETNLRQSYNAGRYGQLRRLARFRPFWRYRSCSDAEHRAWDVLVLKADDPWWNTHFPSNGWGCQCYVEGLNQRDVERLGKLGPDDTPPIQWHFVNVDDRMMRTPKGVDPGFAYAPGKRYLELSSRTANSSPPTAPHP